MSIIRVVVQIIKKLSKSPLQLPLYALAVDNSFDKEIAYATYSGLKKGEIGHKTVMKANGTDNQREKFIEYIEKAKELAVGAIKGIRGRQIQPC